MYLHYCMVRTLLSSSNSMTFHDFFHDLFKISMTLVSVVTFKYFQNFPSFRVSMDLTQFNRHKLQCPLQSMSFSYSPLSYIVHTLTSAVFNLSSRTEIFHDFPGQENEFFNFMTIQVFHNLYKPQYMYNYWCFVSTSILMFKVG